MEMRHLRYFVALAEEANFRRAAERLGIAQPPLSRQIRALERELGCRLVARTSRGADLTAAGRVFLEHARITLAEAQRAVDRARVASPETGDTLVIGCEPAARLAVAGRALARLARRHPTIRVELRDETPGAMVRVLRAGDVQAALVALPLRNAGPDVVVERLPPVPLCLAVAVGHRLAGPRPVSWRRLADEPFVLFAREAAPILFDAIVGTFQAEGVAFRPHHRATELAAALTMVGAGLGVTVLPAGWHAPHSLGVACRPLRSPTVTIAFGVAHRRDARTAVVDRLIHAIRAVTTPIPADAARARARSTSDVAS